MLDNCEIAVLTKLNELAERRGFKPYDFVATYRRDDAAGRYVLEFEVPASGNAVREERFAKMVLDLGMVDPDRAALSGSAETIIDALDRAIGLSPRRPGPRF
ncbi:MAG: hypothetical protein K2X87_16330 [Gemmataceae bacterium]|nr:hypothetical protein [Gemmataceae bacterium]